MESNLCSLNIEMVYSFCLDVSNQIFAELRCTMDHNGTVCGISFGWYGYQHATSRFFLMFCFQITCTGGCFLMNFHEVWMFVLLRIAISGLCYSQIFLFGSLATHVHVVMTCWNVTCSSTLNDVKRTPRNLKNVGNADWSLLRQWQIELRDHAKFEEPDWMKNQTQRNNIIIFLHVWVWGSGLVILLLVNVRAFACSIEWFSVSSHFSPLSNLNLCHVALPSWQFWSYEVVQGVRNDQSNLAFTPLSRSFSVEPWRAVVIFDDGRHFGSYGDESGEFGTLPQNI